MFRAIGEIESEHQRAILAEGCGMANTRRLDAARRNGHVRFAPTYDLQSIAEEQEGNLRLAVLMLGMAHIRAIMDETRGEGCRLAQQASPPLCSHQGVRT
ncbi:hypothetical protein IC614_11485 [Allosphingosinicella flava]|uniref:Uncharacterized protein n=1 Tax=Allosphingosinicella flava TaxID=2771430 RepID=A0A7T2GJD9_9SPHN|nr:hypothetical protein IC614_11485 [Sphingosinicella flava]